MISPDALGRAHKRRVADVIRVALEPRGVIGFIDVDESMSLLDARALICENVENAPSDFQFVLDDGAPVSARQEASQKIANFYPCVKIRACSSSASKSASSTQPSLSATRAGFDSDGESERYQADSSSGPSSTTEKIIVHSSAGDEFSAWISEDYTFQQLRRDASRYWNLPPGQVALTDADGCLWPEQARILSVMTLDELHRKRIVLEHKSAGVASGSSTRVKHLARSQSASLSKLSPSTSFRYTLLRGDSTRGSNTLSRTEPAASVASSMSKASASPRSSPPPNAIEELWLIFTLYCVNGDSLELECIKAHQFNKLLRDARLFGGSLTPAIADIIYTSETKGKPQASGKMSYDEFLNALMKISSAKHKVSPKQPARDADDEEQLFQKLVLESILPLASRWPTATWDVHTHKLRQPEIVSFVSKFLEPLLEIFLFYARSHLVSTASGSKEFYMSYADYQRFFTDFAFANLQLSSVDAAQVFLAACSSAPFHAALFSSSSSSSSDAVDPNAAAIQRVLESFDGVVTYAFPETQIGRMCMGVSAFLDALGRIGLVAFAKIKAIKTLHCVKAIFHHLSRGLSRTRVQEILRNHSSTSIHATKFYSGTVAFNNRFLDMWRYEGSPDYLAGSIYSSLDRSSSELLVASSADMAATTSPNAIASMCGSVVGGGGTLSPAASPARRLMMTSSMFDDRVISSGAGRGREALDRLVRSAFLRSAVDSVNASVATAAAVDSVSQSAAPLADHHARVPRSTSPREQQRVFTEQDSDNELQCSELDRPPTPRSGHRSHEHHDDEGGDDDDAVLRESVRAMAVSQASEQSDSEMIDSLPPPPLSPLNAHAQVRPMSPVTASAASSLSSATAAMHIAPLSPMLRREDERVLFESILLKGGVFKKYGQWGNPHRRYVWCAKDFDAVYWRPLNRKNSLSKEGIAIAGVVAVLPGNSTRTRYAFMKHLSDGTRRFALHVL